jgi:predicted DsbA family dithiol-disulfide isomerase
MTIKVDYYTDILCVWAWIAQRRQDELEQQFGDDIEFCYRFVNVFGNTSIRIGEGWAEKGGYEGFGKYVIKSAAPYEDAPVSERIWKEVRPLSSTPAHLFLKATAIAYSPATEESLAKTIRLRFFTGESADVGNREVLQDIANEQGLDSGLICSSIDSGAAAAELMTDYQLARDQGIKGSPSWVLDGGRQILYGNVGYRVIRANAVELLRHPKEEASWC